MKRLSGLCGQSAVEFLFIFPLCLMLAMAAVDVGRVFAAADQAQAIASDSARWWAMQKGAQESVSTDDVQAYASGIAQSPPSHLALSSWPLSDSMYDIRLMGDDGAVDRQQAIKGKRQAYQVEAEMEVKLFFPFFFFSGLDSSGAFHVKKSYTAFATIDREV